MTVAPTERAERPPTSEPAVSPEVARAHGLSDEEYARLRTILGREPSYTELGITSALWSVHCSY